MKNIDREKLMKNLVDLTPEDEITIDSVKQQILVRMSDCLQGGPDDGEFTPSELRDISSGVASLASAYYNLSQLGEDYGY